MNNTFETHFRNFKVIESAKVIFVQDFLLSDLVGGAELSMDALHKSAIVPFFVIRSNELTNEMIESFKNKHWVFGNFSLLNPQLIRTFLNLKINYSVYEHDYKFCRWRSVEKHLEEGKEICRCEQEPWGKFIEQFYLGAKQLWFCSQRHLERYYERFPSLRQTQCSVLSAVFGEEFFSKIVPIIQSLPQRKKRGWITLDSDSWIKGSDNAKRWLEENKKDYSLIRDITPEQVLEKMADSEGFICLPRGADVSNRMVTEAKLLGCKVVTNNNVQHIGEEWLEHEDVNFTLQWLHNRRNVFWQKTLSIING